jgi:hypothetical protein
MFDLGDISYARQFTGFEVLTTPAVKVGDL